MFDVLRLKTYKRYLNTIQSLLDEYFEDQKEYLCCKRGCSYCCERGTYPFSQIEFDYLMMGVFCLPADEKREIFKRIMDLKQKYERQQDKQNFMHRCPFLNSENICSVYDYRGLICRTFGLLKPNKDGEIIMPFCQSLGLNYSKVYNKEKKVLDDDLMKKYGYKKTPKAYPLSFKNLMNKDLFENENDVVDFGEIKSLIEWL